MAEVIRMPKMSDTMTEGVIVSWQKKEGDEIKPGDILAEVETDKATMELENYVKGTLLHIGIPEGGTVPVDAVIAIVGKKGEDISALLKDSGTAAPDSGSKKEEKEEPEKEGPAAKEKGADAENAEKKSEKATEPEKDEKKTEKEAASEKEEPESKEPATRKEAAEPEEDKEKKAAPKADEKKFEDKDARLKASPLAKKMAQDKGIEISEIRGSGDSGRIVKRDIETYKPEAPAKKETEVKAPQTPVFVGKESFEDVPLSQMRKAIARRLVESKFSAPHFYLTMEINMSRAVEAQQALTGMRDMKISLNDIIIKAVAAAIRLNPKVNASWLGEAGGSGQARIRYNHHIHVGVAVAIDEGLIVPVLKFADNKSISQISAEVRDLASRARNKKLQPNEFEGNTFTVSNLGMYGIEEFTAIINPPDACILAVGAASEKVIAENGEMKIAHMMKVTLSCDHRAVDGAVGSAFLKTLRELLEHPVKIMF